jgi:hypothetical protein
VLCPQCNQRFDPDPRVAGRQVTCGRPECRRRHHAEGCRRWRDHNREETSHHYADVVVSFREKHPTYQREWRVRHALREIRDAIEVALGPTRPALDRLISRGEALLTRRTECTPAALDRHHDQLDELLAIAAQISLLVNNLLSLGRRID